MPELLVPMFAAFFGAFVQGCTGFGFALIAAPLVMLFIAPEVATPMLILLSQCNTSYVAWTARKLVRRSIVLPLALGGALGIPIGVLVLKAAPPVPFKFAVGLLVALFAAALLTGWRKPLRNQRAALVPVGVASGAIGGAVSIGGPPVILFLTNQNMPKDAFRANIVTYFVMLNCVAIVMHIAAGTLTWSVALKGVMFVPFVLGGSLLGVRLSRHLPERLFRRVAPMLAMASGLLLTAQNGAILLDQPQPIPPAAPAQADSLVEPDLVDGPPEAPAGARLDDAE